jgi:hypothetical protein
MQIAEILRLVSEVLHQPLSVFTVTSSSPDIVIARYVAFIIMHEEIHPQSAVQEALNISRVSFYYIKRASEEKLNTDKEFKRAYLACIAAIAEKEDSQ